MGWYNDWKPYVPVAERKRKAMKKMESLRKKGIDIQPIAIDGRKIAKTFWGEAWCDHLESFSDYANRLPRGRTYVRNGSVCHLAIEQGKIEAKVCGSELYTVQIVIKTLAAKKWNEVKRRCVGQIGSLLELLQGRLSDQVMEVVTDRQSGLFPLPGEISLKCSCPDWATMCKHVAAVLYGVGARLDHMPDLLFLLRGVNHEELIAADAEAALSAATTGGHSKQLAAGELADVFGIELDAPGPEHGAGLEPSCNAEPSSSAAPSLPGASAKKAKRSSRKPAKKKAVKAGVQQAGKKRAKKRAKKTVKKTAKKTAKKRIGRKTAPKAAQMP
jgi:uncharacterized Zn finger protein